MTRYDFSLLFREIKDELFISENEIHPRGHFCSVTCKKSVGF